MTKSDLAADFPVEHFFPILSSSGNPETAPAQLLDFCGAFQKYAGKNFNWNRPHTEAFLLIFGRSNFLSRRLAHHPYIAEELLNSSFLLRKKSLEVMESELRKRLECFTEFSFSEFKNELRRYKYEEYLRITVRDLGQLCPFEETLEELSSIAICCLRAALIITNYELGITNYSDRQPSTANRQPFVILGMGKLGGNELNYSSDVDLIFIHDNEPFSANPDKDYKLRNKAARTLIDVMADVTEEGFLARVDMRLRPGGERAPLVQSLDETELYYSAKRALREGLWERQALIKAVPVAGTEQTGKDFMRMITPFVYSRLLDEELLRDVKKVKERIEEEHLRANHLNVKLGVGGIREIEFFVQTFQLLYGGAKPSLRCSGTLAVLEELRKAELIPERDAYTLEEAYLFLRRVEHRLQLCEEHQTHTLPAEVETQQEIARILDYNDADLEKARQRFLGDLKDVMGKVRAIFSGLFSKKHLEIEAAIRNSTRIRHFSAEEQQFIASFAEQLVPFLPAATLAAQAGLSINTKNRLHRLFEAVGAKWGYYRKLAERPSSLSRLMRIAETSGMLWNYLLNHLELLEQLEASALEISKEIWTRQLQGKLQFGRSGAGYENDGEEEIDRLRQFKHSITFLLGSAELEGVLSYKQARTGLTLLAEVITQEAFGLAQKWLLPRYGEVRNADGKFGQFAIIGLGKLGGGELTYHSDLDLIFIHSGHGTTGGPREIGAQEYWVKLIQRLISILSTITRTGYAYKLDTRLRPSGNAGVLVTPLDTYLKYHETSQPWEHQALIKGRIIGGSGEDEWFKNVNDGIRSAVYEWTPPEDMNAQIHHLRKRKEQELSGESENRRNLKEGRGGLLDVEFLTQALQLQHGRKYPQLRCTQTLEALSRLGKFGLLSKEQANILQHSYKLLRLIENGLRLLYDEPTNLLNFEKTQESTILQLLKRHGYEVSDLRETVETTTENIRKIYLNYF